MRNKEKSIKMAHDEGKKRKQVETVILEANKKCKMGIEEGSVGPCYA